MKKSLISMLAITSITFSSAVVANERNDISLLLKEINYLEEVVLKLRKKNRNNSSKVRFNYDAMLAQIEALKQGTIIYLNHDIRAIHDAPPNTVKKPLTKVRKN